MSKQICPNCSCGNSEAQIKKNNGECAYCNSYITPAAKFALDAACAENDKLRAKLSRLRAIEEAAKVVCEPLPAEDVFFRDFLPRLDALRAALKEGAS